MVIHLLASPHRAVLPARFQMAPWFRECNSAFSIPEVTFSDGRLETGEIQSGAGAPAGGDWGGRIGDGLGITTSGRPGATSAVAEGLRSTAGPGTLPPANPPTTAPATPAAPSR